jgi:hypothetical protein
MEIGNIWSKVSWGMDLEDLSFGGFYRLWCSISEINRGNEESDEKLESTSFLKREEIGWEEDGADVYSLT